MSTEPRSAICEWDIVISSERNKNQGRQAMVKQKDEFPPVSAQPTSRSKLPLPVQATLANDRKAETALVMSIVSNCRLLREGLAVMLKEHLTLSIVGYYLAADVQSPDLPNPKGHIVLLDSNIGTMACLDWIRYWRGRSSTIIMIEFGCNVEFLIACIEAGVGAYTMENASIEDIIDALEQVRRGAATCSPELAGKLFARLASYAANRRPMQVTPNSTLTQRELEVLRCASKGYSNQEIADELVISLTTVKHHMHNLLEKLELSHRWDAVRYAEEQGWLVASG
jgi:DNA-binding NarL/FixJ family response regulator